MPPYTLSALREDRSNLEKITVTCVPSEVTAEAPNVISDSSDKKNPTERLYSDKSNPTERLTRVEEVTCRTPKIDKKVTERNRGQVTATQKKAPDKKTARTPMTRKKKQQAPDKNQRKLTDLLNFWQKDKSDKTVAEKSDSQDKNTPRTTPPRVTVAEKSDSQDKNTPMTTPPRVTVGSKTFGEKC